MRKSAYIIVGVLIVAAGVWISRDRAQGTQEENASANVGHASGVSAVEEGGSLDVNVERTSLSAQQREGQAGMPAPQELSDAVKALIGEDGKVHNYSSLLAEINTLSYEIAPDDLAALMDMLNFPNDQFPEGMRPIEINAVKNDVLDKLLRQTVLPEGIGLQMAEMAGNAENDPVWRDYCVQFMEPFYERRLKESGYVERTFQSAQQQGGQTGMSAPQIELTAIHDAMFQALDERGSTIAGTSLIGLELLSRTHEEFDREAIVNKASEIAADEAASSASRLTALRLSAEISNKEQGISNVEVAQAARSLAQTGETVLLRSAAIVTLGEVGSADDRELLESYLLADNRQIAGAAKMALEKMDAR